MPIFKEHSELPWEPRFIFSKPYVVYIMVCITCLYTYKINEIVLHMCYLCVFYIFKKNTFIFTSHLKKTKLGRGKTWNPTIWKLQSLPLQLTLCRRAYTHILLHPRGHTSCTHAVLSLLSSCSASQPASASGHASGRRGAAAQKLLLAMALPARREHHWTRHGDIWTCYPLPCFHHTSSLGFRGTRSPPGFLPAFLAAPLLSVWASFLLSYLRNSSFHHYAAWALFGPVFLDLAQMAVFRVMALALLCCTRLCPAPDCKFLSTGGVPLMFSTELCGLAQVRHGWFFVKLMTERIFFVCWHLRLGGH